MILHASITTDHPQHAAETVAELLGGVALPYPDFGEKDWIAMAGDEHGTLIEFLESGKEFHYVENGVVAHRKGSPVRNSGFHLLVETPHDLTKVLAIAAERDCKAHVAQHGPLTIVEFWIDGCLLIEVATREMAATYRSLATVGTVAASVARTERRSSAD